ncbi:MAG: hypothetical protein QME66_04625 [Candidatus Eisenbacteria bacterium]|nr:hypothetical protein [Candidatus Eisenbacteria bacterium]
MATLAANKPRTKEVGPINEKPVIANDIIYEGACVGDNAAGYMRPLVAGDKFCGIAEDKVDNTGGSAGDRNVRLDGDGLVILPISGLAITDEGKDVYASDDDTFTLVSGSNSRIGYVYRYVSSGVGVVKCEAKREAENLGVFSSVTAGYGIALGATKTAVKRIYADDGGVALTALAHRAQVSRLLITTTIGAIDCSAYGLQGQLKLGAVAVQSTGILGGVWGYVETVNGATVSNAGALVGHVDLPTGAIIRSGCYLAGLLIKSNDLSGTHTGKAVAIYCPNPGAGAFDAFLALDASSTFIADSGAGGVTSKYLKVLLGGTAYSILVKSDA